VAFSTVNTTKIHGYHNHDCSLLNHLPSFIASLGLIVIENSNHKSPYPLLSSAALGIARCCSNPIENKIEISVLIPFLWVELVLARFEA